MIERAHRHFLEVIKLELDRQAIQDINNVQALILYHIGGDELTVGELTARGYYLGTNVSYNVKKMVETGYLDQTRSPHDKRSICLKLSDKGTALRTGLGAAMEAHIAALAAAGIGGDDFVRLCESLRKLERFWVGMVNYGGL